MAGMRGVGQAGVKTAAALADRVRPPAPGLVILLYHRVGARTAVAVDLPADLFEEQIVWLATRAEVVTLADGLAAVRADDQPGPHHPTGAARRRPVAVTFDDGTADLVDVALPILVRHGVPALVYLATDFVERGRAFPDDGVPLSWAAVREAVSTGLVSLGSHTDTHRLLDRVDPDVAAAELDRSRALIEDHVGVTVEDFAYPKAVPASGAVEAVVRDRFRSAAVGGCRPNPFGRTDPHRLARSAIQRSDGMRYFEHKAAGGMALEDGIRRALNRRRYAGAVT